MSELDDSGKKLEVLHAVQYRVGSVVSAATGQGITIEFIVMQDSGAPGKLPAVFMPLATAEELSEAIGNQIHLLRRPN